jgi:hypothetical protein
MDDKTEELRDIFIDATGEETVTESQEAARGSLEADPSADEERLHSLVEAARAETEFRTALDTDTYAAVARGFHDDETDAQLAERLDLDEQTVFDARLDLHLVRESDRDAPFDLDRLRRLVVDDVPRPERADRLDTDEETVRHYSRVAATDLASTRVNDRFRDEFAELLSDANLGAQLATDAREDGLEEATEDIETDVSF